MTRFSISKDGIEIKAAFFDSLLDAHDWYDKQQELGAVEISDEYVVHFMDTTIFPDIEKQVQDARDFLSSTDWYCARLVDDGTAIPAQIKAQRAAARKVINPL